MNSTFELYRYPPIIEIKTEKPKKKMFLLKKIIRLKIANWLIVFNYLKV